ncbi:MULTISPECIES: hypothetical protein [unclassified Rhizobium]|uniref:hypothetical protein n=1 Tax=unclassified Rhizobium TaxID=2613769 RepID=UPI00288AE7F8|nr:MULTISPECIES: hypothetical protein [unclassified Rhizobium]
MKIEKYKAFSAALPLLAAVVLIVVFLTGFYWRVSVHNVMCSGAADEHCGREWLTTLGTLAAAFIAAPALALGLGQIQNASRHHNELLQLQLQPKFALSQRIAELADRIDTARQNVWAALNHDFEGRFSDEASLESAYRSAFRDYNRIRGLLQNPDFLDFEKEIGSGKPHALDDLRQRMGTTYQPSGPTAEGIPRDLFMTSRIEILHNADAVNSYANACLRQAAIYMSRWSRD